MTGQELASTIKFKSDYAKFDWEKGRLETWEDSCERVFDMHIKKLGDKITSSPRLMDLHNRALQAYKNKEVLASQRALQFGGEPILRKNTRNFNCSASYLDRPRFFQEIFWILLCGCGAGYSVQRKDIDKLPKIATREKGALLYEIEDSIEGWADALGVLMSSYFTENQPFPEYAGYAIKFDYSKIRPEGSLISGGFKAPGHLGLKIALEKIETLIEKQLLVTNRLSPIVAHDITCHAADAVLSGGVRRSALICVFDKDDEEMLNAKIGQWWIDNPQRARANNSAMLVRGTFTQEELNVFKDKIKQFGEPGFIIAESDRVVFNPCVTGDTLIETAEGTKSVKDLEGVQFVTRVAGLLFESTPKGFIHTGYQDVFEVITDQGYSFKATENHKVQTKTTIGTEYCTVHNLKVGDKLIVNQSPLLVQDDSSYPKVVSVTHLGKEDVYDCTIPGPAMFGANGLLVSNCAEIGFTCYSPVSGETGWGFCNLNEINGGKPKTKEQFFTICELSAYQGTVQASYTDMPYLTQATKDIIEYEALLGISITGWMDNPSLLFDADTLTQGAHIIREVNKEVADLIGIRQAARTTCSKPSGNASVILGCASGMKPQHSHKYFRLMRMNKNGEVINYIKDKAPSMVVDCDGSDTDYVLYIPITLPDTALVEGQLSAVEFLEKVALAKTYWVDEGKNPGLSLYEGTSHNISNTVTVGAHEWDDVFKYIYEHQEVFSGISFISNFGDKEYNQAPFTAVPNLESLINQYGIGAVFASGLITDGLHLFDDLWVALNKYVLNNVKFVGTRQQTLLMADWVKRVKQFAKKYTKGNLVKTVHLLLDVNHMHLWENINRELPALDNIEEVSFIPEYIAVDTLGAASCFGGACEIPSR